MVDKKVVIGFQIDKDKLIEDMIKFLQEEAEYCSDITDNDEVTELFLNVLRRAIFLQIPKMSEQELKAKILDWWIEYVDRISSEQKRSEKIPYLILFMKMWKLIMPLMIF